MKKQLLIMGGLVLVAFLILLSLNARVNKPNQSRNNFLRSFGGVIAVEKAFRNADKSLKGLSGFNADKLFFCSTDPRKIYVFNDQLGIVDTYNLKIPEIDKLIPLFSTTVSFPTAYILAGNAKCLIKSNLVTGKTTVTKLATDGVFSNATMLDTNSFVMRVVDSSTMNARFKLFHPSDTSMITETDLSLPLQDAGFTYDGCLSYDPQSGKLVFVHYYVNPILFFDRTLKRLYATKTIDTNATTKIVITRDKNGVTHKKPPVTINTYSCVSNGTLYIKSKLKADNETNSNFESNSVIDQYEIATGKYKGSFYLPNKDGHRVLKFNFIAPDKIVAIYANTICIYDLTDKKA